MLASGSLAVMAIVCTWLVYDVSANVGGNQLSRSGYPQAPWFRGGFPASRGDDVKDNKRANNFMWPLPRRNQNPFARTQDGASDDRRGSRLGGGLPSAGAAGFGKANRRNRRDYGLDNRGFYPGAPLFGAGFGYGRPMGDFGQDFGYQSDGWRSK